MLCCIWVFPLTGQTPEKEITKTKLIWFDFTEVVKLNPKWSLLAEYSERFFVDPEVVQAQMVFRTYGMYNAGENWNVGQGFSVFLNRIGDISVHEVRPEQQFTYRQKLEKTKRLGIIHRYRVEERFTQRTVKGEIVSGYIFNMRFRYRLAFEYTLAELGEKKYPLIILVNDEIFLQAGEGVVYNTFNQNRIYTGLSFKMPGGLTITAAYMDIFTQRASGNKYEHTHTFRFSFLHEWGKSKMKKEVTGS